MAKFGFGKGGAQSAKPAREKKPRWERLTQMKQVYLLAHRHDPRIGLYLAAVAVPILVIGFVAGMAVGHPYYATFVSLPLALMAALLLLSKRAEKAAYSSLDGQPGAGGAALQGLKKGWSYQQEPVAVDGGRSTNLAHTAMVYRAVGRPGVVLIAEGPPGRAGKLLAAEQRRVTRLVPNVPVTTYRIGVGGNGALTTQELVATMGKMKNQLTKHEVTEVDRRLRAMSQIRPPLPQGIDPQRLRSMGRGQRR